MDPTNASFYRSLYVEAVQKATAPDSERGAIVYARTALMLELAADRIGWPTRIFGLAQSVGCLRRMRTSYTIHARRCGFERLRDRCRH